MFFIKLLILVAGTLGIVWVSRKALRNVRNHGFYRFFAWEFILILFVLNVNYWLIDPFSFRQIMAWILLIIALVLILQGVQLFRRKGKINQERDAPALVGIEKTTQLVTSGLYHVIRHPFYSSLLFLTWGIFLKRFSWIGVLLGMAATIFLILTAKMEEVENIAYFGEEYRAYMQKTRMFIPYIF
jgi:protein-S-isoprenylcysteine O-methyltransferase Ste14